MKSYDVSLHSAYYIHWTTSNFDIKINRLKHKSIIAVSTALITVIHKTTSFAVTAADPFVLTFSRVGDSRQEPQTPDSSLVQNTQKGVGKCAVPFNWTDNTTTPSTNNKTVLVPNPGLSGQDCKWLQNTKAWSHIIRAVQSHKANLLFLTATRIWAMAKQANPLPEAQPI